MPEGAPLNDRPGLLKCINASCRDAARMLSEQDVRTLSLPERFGLYAHLVICRSCRRYRRSVVLLREVFRRASSREDLGPSESLPPQSRDRIRQKIAGQS